MLHTKYPLEQLALIKKRRLEAAEKALQEKKALLEKEKDKLSELCKERDVVQKHRIAKLSQLRQELDQGTTSVKIQQMKIYLKEVDEQLKQKENKVTTQQKQVTLAEQAVEAARQEMLKKGQAVEKMKLHKEEWIKEQKAIEEHLDSLQTEEMGTIIFTRKERMDATLHQRKNPS